MLKRGSGKIGEEGYQMSSIVWRWNHPHNPKISKQLEVILTISCGLT